MTRVGYDWVQCLSELLNPSLGYIVACWIYLRSLSLNQNYIFLDEPLTFVYPPSINVTERSETFGRLQLRLHYK